MDDELPVGNSTGTHCRYCGHEEQAERAAEPAEHYQVVVACASCGHAFAAFSRN